MKRFIVRFLTALKPTKRQIKGHLLYLAKSHFYNYKPSPLILCQHRVLRNLRKNKDIAITKPDKGNRVVISDRKLYNISIEVIISEASQWRPNFKMLSLTTTLFTKVET